jgi:gamma-glutamyl-gamma-aminobutyrate hydrolase PuuD
MSDLRNHLFETLEGLKDEEKPMEVARAKAVANVAQAIIESVKTELDYIKLTGDRDVTPEFFDQQKQIESSVRPMLRKLGS